MIFAIAKIPIPDGWTPKYWDDEGFALFTHPIVPEVCLQSDGTVGPPEMPGRCLVLEPTDAH